MKLILVQLGSDLFWGDLSRPPSPHLPCPQHHRQRRRHLQRQDQALSGGAGLAKDGGCRWPPIVTHGVVVDRLNESRMKYVVVGISHILFQG